MARVEPPVSNSANPERFVEEAKFEPERPVVKIHDGSDLVDVENCPSELHGHIMCRA